MAGPVASNLVLLTDLATCEPGKKVRFLGWYLHRSWGLQELSLSQHRCIHCRERDFAPKARLSGLNAAASRKCQY